VVDTITRVRKDRQDRLNREKRQRQEEIDRRVECIFQEANGRHPEIGYYVKLHDDINGRTYNAGDYKKWVLKKNSNFNFT